MNSMMTANDNQEDILSRLDAMRVQEATVRCVNYFKQGGGDGFEGKVLDPSCRHSMATWIHQVQTTLSLSPESVWIAMHFFDRYLSSGKGDSRRVLTSRNEFQLAAITCFYTAVKIYEPVVLGIDMLVRICRGTYAEEDVARMEKEILTALDWRVSCHTPMDFARTLLELCDEAELPSNVSSSLLERCQEHLNYAVTDLSFSCCKPSVVGISCLASALTESDDLSLTQKEDLWLRLSDIVDFDLSSQLVLVVQQRLLSNSSPCKPSSSKVNSSPQQTSAPVTAYGTERGSSSPICVTQTARQA
jgi:hypothetical protein